MKKYSAESCHEIGYKWSIEAPDSLSLEDIEAMLKTVCAWTDDPNNERLQKILYELDKYWCEGIEKAKIDEFKKVKIVAYPVHLDAFIQSLKMEDSDEKSS